MTIIHDPLVSRRDFLRLGITVSSGIVLPPLLSACGGGGGDSPVRPEQTFVQPTVLQSVGGLLDVTLTVRYLDTTLPGADPAAAGQKVSLRAYGIGDGRPTITGPTLSVNAGDRLRIRLVNRLPANPVPNPSNPHFLGTPNNTNMHTHGLHVIPGIIDPRLPLYGDYVMDPEGGGVAPGQERQYQYDLRPDHPCGPFWYHPHFHGSSAMQLASFMAGALMIRGPVDALPAMAAASELVFVFQAPLYASAASKAWPGVADGTLESFSQVADSPTGAVSTGGAGIPPVLINGVRRPRIVMGSGEVQRWRFINAQIFNSVNLSLDGHVLHRYTSDGYGSTTYVDFADGRGSGSGLALAPSNRASVTVQAGAPGVYYLRTLPITVAGPGNRGTLPEDILAEVVVVESAGAAPGQDAVPRPRHRCRNRGLRRPQAQHRVPRDQQRPAGWCPEHVADHRRPRQRPAVARLRCRRVGLQHRRHLDDEHRVHRRRCRHHGEPEPAHADRHHRSRPVLAVPVAERADADRQARQRGGVDGLQHEPRRPSVPHPRQPDLGHQGERRSHRALLGRHRGAADRRVADGADLHHLPDPLPALHRTLRDALPHARP